MQQTGGFSSSHQPFTEEFNRKGIISADKLLTSIANSYEDNESDSMPPKCKEIYLTLEIFAKTSDYNADILRNMRQSIQYWRKFIPEDGMRLSEILSIIKSTEEI